MRKRLLILAVILAVLLSAIAFLWQAYDLSADYNYAAAKIDIKNGNVKIVHLGTAQVSSKDKEIEMAAARFGFKNINLDTLPVNQTAKGIAEYNELAEAYLSLRNGPGWKARYTREVDSLRNAAFNEIKK